MKYFSKIFCSTAIAGLLLNAVASLGQTVYNPNPDQTVCAGKQVTFVYTGSCSSVSWSATEGTVISYTNTSAVVRWDSPTTSASVIARCNTNSNLSRGTPVFAVLPTVDPTVSIQVPAASVCQLANVSFSASSTNEGSSPTYDWYIDNNKVGTTSSSSFSYSAQQLSAGSHSAYVALTSSNTCVTNKTISSGAGSFTIQ